MNNEQAEWFILLAGTVLGAGLVAWIAESLGSRHTFLLGGIAGVAIFVCGYLMLSGGAA